MFAAVAFLLVCPAARADPIALREEASLMKVGRNGFVDVRFVPGTDQCFGICDDAAIRLAQISGEDGMPKKRILYTFEEKDPGNGMKRMALSPDGCRLAVSFDNSDIAFYALEWNYRF